MLINGFSNAKVERKEVRLAKPRTMVPPSRGIKQHRLFE